MPEIIERTAKLFEAGEYPDKGLNVTEQDIDTLVSGFNACQVKIEHADSPFDGALGSVTSIWRDGTELKGKIGFPSDAWSLIDRAGAKKLSVGIAKDFSVLKEVSLVKNPRVQSAAVFSDHIEMTTGALDDLYFSSWGSLTADNIKDQIRTLLNMNAMESRLYIDDLGQDFCIIEDMSNDTYTKYEYSIAGGIVSIGTSQQVVKQEKWIPVTMAVNHNPATTTQEVINMADTNANAPAVGVETFSKEQVLAAIKEVKDEFSTSLTTLQQENESLKFDSKQTKVDSRIAEFKRAGKLTPALEPMAKAILMHGSQTVTFGETTTDIAGLFSKFVDTLPALVKFGEVGETNTTTQVEFTDKQKEIFAKLGLKPETVAEFGGIN